MLLAFHTVSSQSPPITSAVVKDSSHASSQHPSLSAHPIFNFSVSSPFPKPPVLYQAARRADPEVQES